MNLPDTTLQHNQEATEKTTQHSQEPNGHTVQGKSYSRLRKDVRMTAREGKEAGDNLSSR